MRPDGGDPPGLWGYVAGGALGTRTAGEAWKWLMTWGRREACSKMTKALGVKEREVWENLEKASVAGASKRVRMPKHKAAVELGTITPGRWPLCRMGDICLRTTGEF